MSFSPFRKAVQRKKQAIRGIAPLVAVAALMGSGALVHGAVITWQTPTLFVNDSVLIAPGAGGYAVSFGPAASAAATTTSSADGTPVTFGLASSTTATVTVATSTLAGFLNAGVPTTTGDAGFDTAVGTGAYTPSANNALTGSITLHGLTVGTSYELQLFFVDTRNSSASGRTFDVGDGSTTATTAVFQYAYGAVAGNTYVGASIVGDFTADATTEVFTSAIFKGATQQGTQINALVLQATGAAVPEPASLSLAAVGASALLMRRSRRAKR